MASFKVVYKKRSGEEEEILGLASKHKIAPPVFGEAGVLGVRHGAKRLDKHIVYLDIWKTRLHEKIDQLHALGICHGNIRAENVLVTNTSGVYLTGFEKARRRREDESDLSWGILQQKDLKDIETMFGEGHKQLLQAKKAELERQLALIKRLTK